SIFRKPIQDRRRNEPRADGKDIAIAIALLDIEAQPDDQIDLVARSGHGDAKQTAFYAARNATLSPPASCLDVVSEAVRPSIANETASIGDRRRPTMKSIRRT